MRFLRRSVARCRQSSSADARGAPKGTPYVQERAAHAQAYVGRGFGLRARLRPAVEALAKAVSRANSSLGPTVGGTLRGMMVLARHFVVLAGVLTPASAHAQWSVPTFTDTTWLSAMAEDKFTHTRTELDLTAGGRGRMAAATHKLAMGFTIGK